MIVLKQNNRICVYVTYRHIIFITGIKLYADTHAYVL